MLKTNKAVLNNNLEKESTPTEEFPDYSACIMDTTSLAQKINETTPVKEVAETFLKGMFKKGPCYREALVFNVY